MRSAGTHVERNPLGRMGTNATPSPPYAPLSRSMGQTIQAMGTYASYENPPGKRGGATAPWIAEKGGRRLDPGGGTTGKSGITSLARIGGKGRRSLRNAKPVELAPEEDPVAVEFGTPLPMDAYTTR